jgi:hypothetical protein
MKKWLPTLSKLANQNTVRVLWVLLVVATMVLGSGAPTAFGGGSSGAH